MVSAIVTARIIAKIRGMDRGKKADLWIGAIFLIVAIILLPVFSIEKCETVKLLNTGNPMIDYTSVCIHGN